MKLVTIFLLFTTLMVGALTHKWDAEELECVEKLNIDKKAVEDNPPFQKVAPEDNEDLNKYYECMWKKEGYLRDDGTFNWDKMHELFVELREEDLEKNKSDSEEKRVVDLTESFFRRLVDTCREKHVHGDTDGQTAVRIHNCFLEEFKKLEEELPV